MKYQKINREMDLIITGVKYCDMILHSYLNISEDFTNK